MDGQGGSRQDEVPVLGLDRPLLDLPGIGPVRFRALQEEGLAVVGDLLRISPLRYEDRRSFPWLRELRARPERKGTVHVQVVEARLIRTRRRGFSLVRAVVSDGESKLAVVWFNQPYLARHLVPERGLFLYGAVRPRRGQGKPEQMENPEIELAPAEGDPDAAVHCGGIIPIYRRVGPFSCRALRRIVHAAVRGLSDQIRDPIPEAVRRQYHLPGLAEALRHFHFPAEQTDLQELAAFRTDSQRRMIWEELFLLSLALEGKRVRRLQVAEPGGIRIPDAFPAGQGNLLPFSLTDGQQQALRVIGEDLRSPIPMACLLQGDVGSGKTVVAALAMLATAEHGRQAALMVPTELLAEQHHAWLKQILRDTGIPVGLLTGSRSTGERRRIGEALADGRLSLVVGTHALIQGAVAFHHLGLVVIDEQHRFGVAQRLTLSAKGRSPDLLVMTATPIPRSLALVAYGDLEHVEIRDRPAGRKPVVTEILPMGDLDAVWDDVRREAVAGRRIYVVCPLVESSHKRPVAAAVPMHAKLAREVLADRTVGLVHGRMPAGERDRVMQAFASGAVSVLVATTVIEVGVDVAQATLMVVLQAEQFGLAQLHQLRGRIGRGRHASRCILVHGDDLTEEARRRLDILERTSDGFEIARHDLAIRGPGELLGKRQHGAAGFRVADLVRDEAILEQARQVAGDSFAAGLPNFAMQAARHRWGARVGYLSGE